MEIDYSHEKKRVLVHDKDRAYLLVRVMVRSCWPEDAGRHVTIDSSEYNELSLREARRFHTLLGRLLDDEEKRQCE